MIYFDNAATTKPSKNAIEKAMQFNETSYFNPSALYQEGINASNTLNMVRQNILKYLGLSSSEYKVVFTSCGSESDNLAIFGNVKRGVFVTDKGEHSAVFKSFNEHLARGNSVVFIDVNNDGSVNVTELLEYIKNNKVDFVSIVHVNNETGAINDVNYISSQIKKINPKIIFHCDGVQAFGKIPFKMNNSIDFYAISAHKINGLKGVGALICKKSLNLNPIIYGGGQEGGVRSGTENVFGIKVLDYAMQEHFENLLDNFNQVKSLNIYVQENINKDVFTIISNENCSPYILSISAKGLKGEVLMHSLEIDGFIVGNGSACSSRNKYSRVLQSCGYKNEILEGVIRISFSHENTIEEVKSLVNYLNIEGEKLKRIMLK